MIEMLTQNVSLIGRLRNKEKYPDAGLHVWAWHRSDGGTETFFQNQAVLGHDNYPDTLAAAYRILTKYDPGPTATNTHNRVGYRADVAFTQEGGNRQLVAGVDGRKYPGIFCFGCGSLRGRERVSSSHMR